MSGTVRFGSRLLRRIFPGYGRVHDQVAPYAVAWGEANRAAEGSDGPLWVVLGDSTAQGIGASAYDAGYVGKLRALLDACTRQRWRVLNLSVSGARATDVLSEQIPQLLRLPAVPDLVTLAVGANDLLRRSSVRRLMGTLGTILAELPEGAVVATLPQGLGRRRALEVNAFIRDEADDRGLRVADVWARTGPPWNGKFASDGFHPNDGGYQDWVDAFAEVVTLSAT